MKPKTAVTVGISIGILLIGILFYKQSVGSDDQNSSTFERVTSSKKIVAGYLVYPPGCIKDPNTGELSGIHIDTMNEVAKALEFEIEWKEASGWGTMIEDVESSKVDLIGSPVWANSTRSKHAYFGPPLFYSGVCAFVRSNDTRFDNAIEKVNDASVKIATMDGELVEIIANSDFPKATQISLPQNSELSLMLENVAAGKADITFAEPFFVNLYLESNPGTLKNITPTEPLRIFPNCSLLPKGDDQFRNMISVAIEEQINSGKVDKLIDKYSGTKGSVYRVLKPYASRE